tara:strand:- start:1217 stop:1399 length:183 start_codon:yes stop_codon:yes gene_type:complete
MNISKDFKLDLCMLFYMRDVCSNQDTLKKLDLMINSNSAKINENELLDIRLKFNTFYNSL